MRIALAQINPTVGDLAGNSRLIISWMDKARAATDQGVDEMGGDEAGPAGDQDPVPFAVPR